MRGFGAISILTLLGFAPRAALAEDPVAFTAPVGDLCRAGTPYLANDDHPELARLFEAARAAGGAALEVSVQTDSQGSDTYNRTLSQKRAETLVAYLAEQGIQGSRLTAVGHGETRPIQPNTTSEDRLANRRVELRAAGAASDGGQSASAGSKRRQTPASPPERDQPTFPHQTAYVDFVWLHKADFSHDWLQKTGGMWESSITFRIPREIRGERSLTFMGPGAQKGQGEWSREGRRLPAASGPEVLQPGSYTLTVRAPSRKTVASAGLLGEGGPAEPPSDTADLCTVLDYVTFQASKRYPDLVADEDGMAMWDRLTVAGLEAKKSGEKVRIPVYEGQTRQTADETYVNVANVVGTCFDGRMTHDQAGWGAFTESFGVLRPARMGVGRDTLQVRSVSFVLTDTNAKVTVEQRHYPGEDRDDPDRVIIGVERDAVVMRR